MVVFVSTLKPEDVVDKYSEVPNKQADRNKRVCWNVFENLVLILE